MKRFLLSLGLLLVANIGAATMGAANAGTICKTNSWGDPQCFYFNRSSCEKATTNANERCIPNYKELNIQGDAPYCVALSFGAQCYYYKPQQCQQKARQSDGVCFSR